MVSAAAVMAVVCVVSNVRAAPCPVGVVRGPIIDGPDIAAVQRAVVVLPAASARAFPMGVGAVVPRDLPLKPVPAVVVKLLPQYAGYRAFRSGFVLMIVNPRTRRISYRLPLRKGATEAC